MATREIDGQTVEVNEEGYLTDPGQWTEEIAHVIAGEEGIGELTEAHWNVLKFLQADFKEKETMPTIRRVKTVGGIPTKDLYALFPGGPLKKSAKIAGLPKPKSCI